MNVNEIVGRARQSMRDARKHTGMLAEYYRFTARLLMRSARRVKEIKRLTQLPSRAVPSWCCSCGNELWYPDSVGICLRCARFKYGE